MIITRSALERGLALSNARLPLRKVAMDAQARLKENSTDADLMVVHTRAHNAYLAAEQAYLDWLHVHGHLLIEMVLDKK